LGAIYAYGTLQSYNGLYVYSDGGTNELLNVTNGGSWSQYSIGALDWYPAYINIGNSEVNSSYITLNSDTYYGGNNYFNKSLQSNTFTSGFGGEGWQVTKSGTKTIATFDDLWVRGSMNVY